MFVKLKNGLRPVGSLRTRTFDIGESGLAARTAESGDELTRALVDNMTDAGLDRFSGALAARGLEFGDVTSPADRELGTDETYVIYPCGNPRAVCE